MRLAPDHRAVEEQGGEERQPEHDRDLDEAERQDVADAVPEARVAERLDVVVEADEGPPADEPRPEQAQVQGVDEGKDQEDDEDDEERRQEQVGRARRAGRGARPAEPIRGARR